MAASMGRVGVCVRACLGNMELLHYLFVVEYQHTFIMQALHYCFPTKEPMTKRAICHYPNSNLPVRLTKAFKLF